MQLVFTYGTLRPSLRKEYGFYKDTDIPEGRLIGDAITFGYLYQITATVPGASFSWRQPGNPRTQATIKGEVVEFTDEEMVKIDFLERAYSKIPIHVHMCEDGTVVPVFAYQINSNFYRSTHIPSGDWAAHLKENKK